MGELLDVEELLELDTILLFRRFVGWQMDQLHGAAVAREAFVGSEIEDLLRADDMDRAETGAREKAEAGGADAAFEVEMLRHIVQVTTGRSDASSAAVGSGRREDYPETNRARSSYQARALHEPCTCEVRYGTQPWLDDTS